MYLVVLIFIQVIKCIMEYYITIETLGNAQDFGEFNCKETQNPATMASPELVDSLLVVIMDQHSIAIDFVTFASTGNAHFGDLLTTRNASTGTCSNQTRGIMFVGRRSLMQTNAMDYVTMASSSNGIRFW